MEIKSVRGKTEFLIQFIKFTTILTVLSIYPYIAAQTGPPTPRVEQPSMQRASMFDLFFERFLAGGRVETIDVRTATVMVAREGNWQRVIEKLKSEQAGAQINCIRFLGLIAEKHANLQYLIELNRKGEYHGPLMLGTGDMPPTEIVPVLLDRAKSLSSPDIDHYVIALARARDPRCKEFFLNILNQPDPRGYDRLDMPRFHAAVGLANIHEPAGVEWLIEHSASSQIQIRNAWPADTRGSRLDQCCDRALIMLSGRSGIEDTQNVLRHPTKDAKMPLCECVFSRGPDYWRKWWDEAGHQLKPDARIGLVDWQQ